jgi:phage terminase large subunit
LTQRYTLRFLCTRQFQNKIADSVYTLLEFRAKEFGIYDQFRWLETTIVHKRTGSEFIFYGIARNLSEIKSMEGVDIAWHEECQLMTKEQWLTIDPTLRKNHSQHWMIFNPRLINDFTYQHFVLNPPEDTIVRKINYTENPFLSDTIKKRIAAFKKSNPDDFAHVYLGEPLTDDDNAVIKRSWIEAAVDAHIRLNLDMCGERVMGFDIADDGHDTCANTFVYGSIIVWCDEWKAREDELLKSATRTYHAARQREATIRYDCIGVGASAGAKFDELNCVAKADRLLPIRYNKFNAGSAVHDPDGYYVKDRMDKIKNKDYFANLKSQTWWAVADRFRNTYDAVTNGTKYPVDELISIDSSCPHLEKLKAELSTPLRDFDKNGRVKVESKDDLKKRGVDSPNIADSLVMCFGPRTFGNVKISADAVARARIRR